MKIAFLTNGTSPVPATKGGAVENLIEDLLDENEKRHSFDFSVFSLYEEKATEQSKEYKNSNFYFVKPPKIINCLDKVIYWIAKNLLKKMNLISYRYILRRLYVMSKFPPILLKNDFDRIILVTNSTLFFVLKDKRVKKKYKGKTIYYLHNEVRSLFKCEKEAASIRSLPLITTNSGGIPEYIPDEFAYILDRNKELINNISRCILRIKNRTTDNAISNEEHRNKFIDQIGLEKYFEGFEYILKKG